MEDLTKIKAQTKSKDIFIHKLEEMLKNYFMKIDKLKSELEEVRTENNFSKEKITNLNNLNEQLKKAVVKYKEKSEELDKMIKDKDIV